MKEDAWIPTVCSLCYSHCALMVHRVNGVVSKIEGNPECPTVSGRICPRGLSGIMLLYDPNRVNFPLKRTNPKKGIGIDPGWVEISWDEALGTIVERLKKIREDDSRKLLCTSSVTYRDGLHFNAAFATTFGSPNSFASGAGSHCGNGEHLMGGLLHASWAKQPDLSYMNYFLNFGCPAGFGAYYAVTATSKEMADARVRGMRHVVIDPWLSPTAEKADEWVPIRPGTDAALALAMVNILLNQLEIYDAESIKSHTNGPYLVGADSYFVRDKASGKPSIWDPIDNKAKEFDDPTIKDFALDGDYTINGRSCRPAFSLIKEQVKKYSAEAASEITTIPVSTIHRLAREFGKAAHVGSKIVVEGKELPYRPVGVGYFRGAQGHKHCALTCMALELLSEIVGAADVPGAMLGMNARSLGSPFSGKPQYSPTKDQDGLLVTGDWVVARRPYPFSEPTEPESVNLNELVPTCVASSPLLPLVMIEPEKYKIPYKVEFHLHNGGNYLMTLADPSLMERAFRNVFTVSFSLYRDDSTELSDIVIPDTCYLERLDISPDWMANNSVFDSWSYHIRQPVVTPTFQRRQAAQVLLEIAERLDMLPDIYRVMNLYYRFAEPYTLQPTEKYSWEEIVDRRYKSFLGPDYGLEWFKKNGVLKWPKRVEEVYWKPFVKARVPVYFESFKRVGEQIEAIKKKKGIPGFDTADFQPLPDWKPCPGHLEKPGYDLLAIYYRVPFHTFSSTYNIPWLDEVSRIDPFAYHIAINKDTALSKGINNGDWVEVESADTRNKARARARLTEGIHPEVIAMANCGGHWSKHLPIASQRGKGVCFEWLMALDFDHIDTVTLNQDLCVKVKVAKAMPAES